MTAIILVARLEQRPTWLSEVERELSGVRGLSIAARVSTSTAAVNAAREQLASGRHAVVIVCNQQLDEGDAVDVARGCREMGVAVLTLIDRGETPPVEAMLNLARTPLLFQPGPARNIVDAIRELAEPAPVAGDRNGPDVHPSGRVVAIASAESAGKTTLSIALAVHLARALGTDAVALLELINRVGSAEVLMGLPAPADHRIEGLLAAIGDLTSDDLRRAAQLTPVGCRLIAGPGDLEHAALVEPTQVHDLIGRLRRTFAVTVIDTASYMDDVLVATLLAADFVVWVTTLRLVAVRNLLHIAKTAERLGLTKERMGVVVNGAPSRVTSTHKQLHRELAATFPDALLPIVPLDSAPWTDWIERGDTAPEVDSRMSKASFVDIAEVVMRRLGVQYPQLVPTDGPLAVGSHRGTRGSSGLRRLFGRAAAFA